MPRNPDLLDHPAPTDGAGFINPYNFVRFGKPASRKAAPSHEKLTGLSGRITCEIELLTPICVPDAEASGSDENIPERKIKKFSRMNNEPYIPATEIKGVIRSVAEAVSGSCLSILGDQFQIFRDNRNWVPGDKKLGKLKTVGGSPHHLEAPVGVSKYSVPKVFPRRGLYNQINKPYNPGDNPRGNSRGYKPWSGPNEDIPQEVAELYHLMVQSKEFVLGEEPVPPGHTPTHWKDRHIWKEDDATLWLTDYDNHHKPAQSSPYWWFRKASVPDEKGNQVTQLIQIGRNFRYKWAYKTFEAIPELFHPCETPQKLCLVCRLFGMVAGEKAGEEQKAQVHAVAGRVMFSSTKWIGGEPKWGFVDALKILNTPKASCRSFYLQPKPSAGLNVRREEYLKMQAGKLVTAPGRGRKFYWHHTKAWSGKNLDYVQMLKVHPTDTERPKNKLNSDIEVLMPPEKRAPVFTFEVSFENLVDSELGLLIWSLALPESNDLAHHLGLGKPLGLGSVKIKVKSVDLVDRKKRYENLLSLGKPSKGEDFPASQYLQTILTSFRDTVKRQNGVDDFNKAENVADLLVILSTQQPLAADGRQVKITYPPGLDVDQDAQDLDVNYEEIHHTWFGTKGWQWSQRLLTIAEISHRMRQLL